MFLLSHSLLYLHFLYVCCLYSAMFNFSAFVFSYIFFSVFLFTFSRIYLLLFCLLFYTARTSDLFPACSSFSGQAVCSAASHANLQFPSTHMYIFFPCRMSQIFTSISLSRLSVSLSFLFPLLVYLSACPFARLSLSFTACISAQFY